MIGMKVRPLIDEKDAFREIAGLKPRPDEHPGSARRRLIAAMAENALPQLKPEPVETVTSTGEPKPPKRAHSMTIRLHAHDIDELFDVLSEIVAEQRRDGAHSVVSSCGYDVEYVFDPLQTEGRYRDQLDQYLSNIRGSGRT